MTSSNNNNKEKEPWYQSDEEWDNKEVIESNVVLRLSDKFDIAAEVVSERLGYKSFDEYVSDLVKYSVRKELDGAGSFELDEIAEMEKQIAALIERQRKEIDR